MLTERLEVRPPVERDRARFVELFADPDFMAFAAVLGTPEAANARFDGMLVNCAEIPFAKQPVIERSSGSTIGYCGVAPFEFEGSRRLEFGWRLVRDARGRGYATEAARAVLTLAAETFRGEVLAIIDPANHPSSNVARKLGFEFWKRATEDDDPVDLYRISIG